MRLETRVPYKFIGSDFSGQEPRMLCTYSQDQFFMKSLAEGKDPYSTIAVQVYKNNYEDNLEHYPDGSLYTEGSKRRKSVKGLLLGLMYGMGTPAVAERLNVSIEEAQAITDDFFNGFPGIKVWMDQNLESVHKKGYVEDLWGRRRRLPDANLPEFTVEMKKKDRKWNTSNGKPPFNPLLGTNSLVGPDDEKIIAHYKQRLTAITSNKSWGWRQDVADLKQDAEKRGVVITNNGAFISRAERQVTNAAIQGGAATLTKKAMLNLNADELMNSYGFKLLIGVHDELIGEVPIEYAEVAAERLSYIMCEAGKPLCTTQMKCDAMVFPGVGGKSSWYADVYFVDIKNEYNKYIEENSNTAMSKLVTNHPEFLPSELEEIIKKDL